MRRVWGILFSLCFLVSGLAISLMAKEVEKLIIEQDTVITEDTTWTEKDVIINEGVTFIVKNATLTIKEGNFINKGSFIVENANLVRESKIWKRIYNYGILELRNSTINFIIYLYKDSTLSADNSKLGQIYFHGDNAQVTVNNCDISRLHPQRKVTVKVTGKCKIRSFDISIRISDNAKVTYVNNKFSEESQGYVIPEVSVSSETETKPLGYGMWIGKSAEATIKQSQLLYLDVYKDSKTILNDCKLLSTRFGGTLNHGGVFIATNYSFRWVETINENALSTLTNCTITGYVKNTKGRIHLVNTKVAGIVYKDRTLVEGEKLPLEGLSFYTLQGEFI